MKTIKQFIILTTLTLFCYSAQAQQEGTVISPYVGIAGTYGSDKLQTPSFDANLEFFLDESFALGFVGGYSTEKADISFGTSDDETSGFFVGGLLNYYRTDEDDFNFYTETSLGYTSHDGPVIDGGFFYEVHIGGRYQLSNGFSIFSELGYGLVLLKVGVSV
ncbi:MAG: hypothetical protein GKR88_02840 [Flavobacteriaceae bacterium]|nr:MAG: hypothetical protein GKR88_02840 [Flavobacteriaceae bacterium]